MSRYKWTIYTAGRFIDSGSIDATSEQEALNLALIDQAGKHDADTSYNVSVGGSSASSFGDEFERTAGASSIDDTQLTPAGHTFAPSLADVGIEAPDEMGEAIAKGMVKGAVEAIVDQMTKVLGIDPDQIDQDRVANATNGCTHPNMNEDATHPASGEIHAQCHDCGYIAPKGTGRIDPSWKPFPGMPKKYATGGIVKGTPVFLDPGAGIQPIDVSRTPVDTGGLRKLWQNGTKIYDKQCNHPLGDPQCMVDEDEEPHVYGNFVFPELTEQEKANQLALENMREQMTRSMGVPLKPDVIPCACGTSIAVSHLPLGDTSGVPCPGCDATYTVRRDF